jgi:hypothetical protein
MAQTTIQVSGTTLVVPPFRIEKHGQTYLTRSELRIDLSCVEPGPYRVVAVHNFLVEDRSPDLRECIAGVFLARRRSDGRWQEPEAMPLECRSLAVLGYVDVHDRGARAFAR